MAKPLDKLCDPALQHSGPRNGRKLLVAALADACLAIFVKGEIDPGQLGQLHIGIERLQGLIAAGQLEPLQVYAQAIQLAFQEPVVDPHEHRDHRVIVGGLLDQHCQVVDSLQELDRAQFLPLL